MKKELFIIDDDPIYRMIVSKMVEYTDSSLIINESENGRIGLAKLEDIKNSKDKIIVVLDINMPILDGWGFLDEIEKCHFYDLDELVIYLVSSSTDESDILKSKRYKFVKGFFHKPLTNEDIKTIIGSN
ncbi:MAG: response regulator [Bacteroidetes bacterium]|nr:response regulator [Bacteroidota bacterium]